MVKNLLNYDNLIKHLRKKGYKEVREGEFIVNEDEEFEIADVLVVRKGQNYKEDLSKLKKEIEESASLVEGERKEYGILFVDNYVIFLRRVTDGLRSRVVTLRKSLDKISPAFEKKFKKLLKDIGNWQYWDELFDRSDIIEEFYKLYIKARENLLKNIKGIADDKKKEEFADDLLMQLLIIWYLQERGFLNNDPRYLVTKFKEYKELGFDSYYEFLRELFKAMMSEPNDGIYYKDDKFGRIVVTGPAPFLNGDFEDVEIPDYVFYVEGKTDLLKRVDPKNVKPSDVPILNLFESRDWTEGNIDEFVLGAIFEKLMTAEDRKEKGAYYTPEPITEYICNNTIKPYLVDRINEKFGTKYESLDEFFEKDTNEKRYAFLFNEMQNIKILDPACGSGHFLETAINVLVEIYEKIWERAREIGFSYENFVILTANEKGEIIKEPLLTIVDENERILKLKFHIIISRNIYGVDILPSAIKVARARLFLSLAKHFDARKGTHVRFPNVHFNLRVGNSLIGFTDLNAFERIEGQATLEQFFVGEDGEPLSIELDKELEDYIKKMDKVIGTNAYALLAEVRDHFGQRLTQDRLKKVLRLRSDLIKILLVSLNTDYAIRLKRLIDEITDRFNEKLNDEFVAYLEGKGIKIDVDYLREIGYFHWIMEFSEVFLEKGGFDVVIGNPPYVDYRSIDKIERRILNLYFESTKVSEKYSYYIPFTERSIQLNRYKGNFCFIMPQKWLSSDMGLKLRKLILDNFSLYEIVDLLHTKEPVFKGQSFANVGLYFISKRKNSYNNIIIKYGIRSVRELNTENGIITKINEITFLDKRIIVPKAAIKIVREILKKSMESSKKLSEFVNLEWGTSSSYGNIITTKKKDTSFLPFIQTSDIDIFVINWQGYFIPSEFYSKNRLNKFKFKKLVITRRSPIMRCAIDVAGFALGKVAFATKSSEGDLKYLCTLLNSRLLNFIYFSLFETQHPGGSFQFDIPYLNYLPIKEPNNLEKRILSMIHDLISFSKLELKDKDNINLKFYLKFLIDLSNYIVYELYFKEKFIEDSKKAIKEGREPIYSQLEKGPFLVDLVAKYLKPIDYDSYARLRYSIEPLSEKEKQRMEKMKGEYLKTIEEVVEAIRADKEIIRIIERIKEHEWVKVIEKH